MLMMLSSREMQGKSSQPIQDNTDFLFSRITPPGGPANIMNRFLCTGFLGFSWHHRFLWYLTMS
jgi:hypothetical protein